MAGGKRWPIGRQHNCTHVPFVRNFCERVTERTQERFRQAVARFGPVERQDCDAPGFFAQENRRRSRSNAGRRGSSVY